MFYIKEKHEIKYEIKHSLFIAIAIPLANVLALPAALKEIKKTYPKATHYPYAYFIDNVAGSTDDGEPAQTSGKMIMEVINNNRLNHILIVVVRYYGGIKLGKALLGRTYLHCAKLLFNTLSCYQLVTKWHYKGVISYQRKAQVVAILGANIIKMQYDDNITLTFALDSQELFEQQKYLFTSYQALGQKSELRKVINESEAA